MSATNPISVINEAIEAPDSDLILSGPLLDRVKESLATANVPEFTLGGLPGSGKTATMQWLGKLMDREVINTDVAVFSPARRDPNGRGAPFQGIVQSWLDENPERRAAYEADPDLLGKSGELIEKFGNAAFRDLEQQLIIGAMEQGTFNGGLVDCGGSVLLREATRSAFGRNGITGVHLQIDVAEVADRIEQDYIAIKNDTFGGKDPRSNITKRIDSAVAANDPRGVATAEERAAFVRGAIEGIVSEENQKRDTKYAELEKSVRIPRNQPVAKTGLRVLKAVMS